MDDLISRQAAIEALEREKTYCTAFREGFAPINVFEKYNAGLTDGIKALKKLPSAQPELDKDINVSCNDAISRQAAIDAIYEMHVDGEKGVKKALPNTYGADLREIVERIEDLPSAQPERKKMVEFYAEKAAEDIIKLLQKMDVVKVVRCKDCKWYKNGFCENLAGLYGVREDSYCSRGERKEKTDEH